ncbi:hypothetical protein [Lacrimispora celerecrescens]|uniref:XkdQ/YqbQ family protein n=1 Tax=Lacrimispora celerecrescens TaxID=29354 RepID=UPI001649FA54|nr:hypothetical protein [Lacrimispora celerecrescens]
MVEDVSWSGSLESVARTADVAIINAPYDCNISSLPRPITGDYITLAMGSGEIFTGRIYGIEKTSEYGTVTVNCIDNLQYLLKSKGRYNFKNTTAEAITTKVLADIQFPMGDLIITGINIKSMLCQSDTVYDIITNAYAHAHKVTGKSYQCKLVEGKLSVLERGGIVSGYRLSDELNITKTSFTESTESIVNKVKIYDKKGQQVGEVTDEESIKTYGLFTDIYEVEDGINPNMMAKTMLYPPEQTLSLEAIGDMNCISGYGVTVEDGSTGMRGVYMIKSDNHEFKGDIHTMQLELDFMYVE